jgi:UDP:flavonoid glycosyltransferase YjiC (YdhE family)
MHGGSNTLLAVLDVGLPSVVVPLIADQFFNAHVVDSLRLGRVAPREQLTPASIRAAVEDALANPLYRRAVARLRAEMHALPGQEAAVRMVEQIVADHARP